MHFALNTGFDIASVRTQLEMMGGVSLPMLCARDRSELLAEALTYQYVKRPFVVGAARVQQDMSGVDTLRTDSAFFALRDDWQALWEHKFRELPDAASLFSTSVHFNELSLQRYEPGSRGITPHRDSSRNINLICIFTLTGHSRFGLCEDRQGTKVIAFLDDAPGNVILLRARGFNTPRVQPFHFLTDTPELRISFGLRQVANP